MAEFAVTFLILSKGIAEAVGEHITDGFELALVEGTVNELRQVTCAVLHRPPGLADT
jgi:hypothetical protein